MFMLGDASNDKNTLNTGLLCIPVTVLISIILIPFLQIFFGIGSRNAIVISYIISIITTNIHLSQSNSDGNIYIFINTSYILLLCVSYEIERSSIGEFVRFIKTLNLSRSHASLELKLANEKVEESDRILDSKRQIVKHVGHEVRTPLNIMVVGVETISHELLNYANMLPSLIFTTIDFMKDAANDAVESINELMLFEKLSVGMNCIEPTTVYLVKFLKDCMKFHYISAQAKSLQFELIENYERFALLVNIDPLKMKTVFRNILSNAIKFTPMSGEVILKVAVLSKAIPSDREYVVISVKDSGAGMSAKNILEVFKEGVQFNANKLQDGGGSGLGLFISKKIVEQHDGCTIWVESAGEDCGSTFFVKIPVMTRQENLVYDSSNFENCRPHSDEMSIEESHESFDYERLNRIQSASSISSASNSSPMNVLIVDDSTANRKVMSRLLMMNGFTPYDACDGSQAVEMVLHSLEIKKALLAHTENVDTTNYIKYDVVLMDFKMPEMNGPQATAMMREMGYDGPIIGITGWDDNIEFLTAGADKVLIKPVSASVLKQSIESAIHARANIMLSNLHHSNDDQHIPSVSSVRNSSGYDALHLTTDLTQFPRYSSQLCFSPKIYHI